MLRDPIQTIYSCYAMAKGRSPLLRDAFEQLVPYRSDGRWLRKELWPGQGPPALHAIAASVAGFILKTGGPDRISACRTFRVEDLEVPSGLERFNAHNQTPLSTADHLTELCDLFDPENALHRHIWDQLHGALVSFYPEAVVEFGERLDSQETPTPMRVGEEPMIFIDSRGTVH